MYSNVNEKKMTSYERLKEHSKVPKFSRKFIDVTERSKKEVVSVPDSILELKHLAS